MKGMEQPAQSVIPADHVCPPSQCKASYWCAEQQATQYHHPVVNRREPLNKATRESRRVWSAGCLLLFLLMSKWCPVRKKLSPLRQTRCSLPSFTSQQWLPVSLSSETPMLVDCSFSKWIHENSALKSQQSPPPLKCNFQSSTAQNTGRIKERAILWKCLLGRCSE